MAHAIYEDTDERRVETVGGRQGGDLKSKGCVSKGSVRHMDEGRLT